VGDDLGAGLPDLPKELAAVDAGTGRPHLRTDGRRQLQMRINVAV
jgi:hypothetical protein